MELIKKSILLNRIFISLFIIKMKKIIENAYTSMPIEVDENGFIIRFDRASDAMDDYGSNQVYSLGEAMMNMQNLTYDDLIGSEESLKQLNLYLSGEIEPEDDEKFLRSLEIKIDWELVYEEDDEGWEY